MNNLKSFSVCILLTVISLSTCFGQKQKTVEIYKNNTFKDYMHIIYVYDENNAVKTKYVRISGKDSRGYALIVTSYFGTPIDAMKFITDVEKFVIENDPGTSATIDGQLVNIDKVMGIKYFNVYEKDGIGGYRGYSVKSWTKLKNALTDWTKENNEPLE